MDKREDINRKKEKNNTLKWEVAEDLNLDDDSPEGGVDLPVREAGKIRGNMVTRAGRKLGQKGKEAIEENDQK